MQREGFMGWQLKEQKEKCKEKEKKKRKAKALPNRTVDHFLHPFSC